VYLKRYSLATISISEAQITSKAKQLNPKMELKKNIYVKTYMQSNIFVLEIPGFCLVFLSVLEF